MARSKPTDNPAPSGKAGRGPGAGGRGRGAASSGSSAASGKAGKGGGKGEKKPGRLKRFGRQLGMIKQAYSLTRKNDPKLPWILLITFVAVFAVIEVIAILVGSPFLFLPIAVLLAALVALIVFGRRAQGTAYRQVEGQPGAASWVLDGMRGDWQVTSGVAGTPQLDAVHRVTGRPGIILVGEGAPNRVRNLLAQEKKKIARVVGDTPIYDIVVGDDEGQVPLRKLSAHVMKLPRNLSGGEVNALRRRMGALGGPKMPVPGGPLPGGRQMTISQRQVRRR
ncbi:DUF4191 domain-containing protein [Geodermatophilus sp. SYSU D00691]